MPFCTVGGPQDPQHYHGAGDATHGTRRDELVETLRQGGPFLGIYSSFLNLRFAVWSRKTWLTHFMFQDSNVIGIATAVTCYEPRYVTF